MRYPLISSRKIARLPRNLLTLSKGASQMIAPCQYRAFRATSRDAVRPPRSIRAAIAALATALLLVPIAPPARLSSLLLASACAQVGGAPQPSIVQNVRVC